MRNDLLRALAGQRVEATPVMGDAEKTTILGATPGYGGGDWDEDDEAARKRKRTRVIIAVVAAVLVLGGVITAALLLNSGGDEEPPPAAQQVAVPTLVGLPQAEAETAITGAGLAVGEVTTEVTTDDAQVGNVLSSNPASGARVDEGTAVDLVVGAEPDSIAVPPVVNLDEDDARTALENAGLTGNINRDSVDSLEPEGTVVAVDPEQGSQVAPDTTITLSVSDGDAQVRDVVGQQQDAATEALRGDGFTNVRVEQVEDEQPAGTVVAMSPAGGSQATADTQITLQVSSGPGEIAVPTLAGQTEAAARAALQQAGFTGSVSVQPSEGDGEPAGTVVGSDPAAGQRVAPDTAITLLVVPPGTPGGGTPADPNTPGQPD
jgi:serine/threonine-protein kinase